jgi:hypothetical protein
MRTLRDIYWIILLLFVAANLLFVFRTESSFWALGISPAILDSHRLSPDDYDRLDDAGDIVRQIIVITAVTSLVTSLASLLVLRTGVIRFRWLPMLIMTASAAWGIFLLLQGNRFAFRTPMVSACLAAPLHGTSGIAQPVPRAVVPAHEAGREHRGIRQRYRIQPARHVWSISAMPAAAHSFGPADRRSRRAASSSERPDDRRPCNEVAVAGGRILAEPLPWSMVEIRRDAPDEWSMEAVQ